MAGTGQPPQSAPQLGALLAALRDPSTHGCHGPVEVEETHISWVFLAGDRVYKLKKPIVLDFVDYGSEARRHAMCRREVDLNRRLAPSIYLGVRSVVPRAGGFALAAEDDAAAVEHVVEMRRFDARRTLSARLDAGDDARIAEVGALLADFHARAEVARPPEVIGDWEKTLSGNVEQLLELAPEHAGRLREQLRFARAFLAGRGGQLVSRRDAGRVRDGHGDLRTDHVVLEDVIAVVDCVEFDSGLRRIDVCADVAYLVADLEIRGAAEIASELVAAYDRAGGDLGDAALLSFFCAYRALVAAKIAVLRGEGPQGPAVRRRLDTADAFAWRTRLAPVTVVCGVSASGKSTVAEELARRSGLAVLSSDRVRKELMGRGATDRLGPSAYAEPVTRRVYARLGELASEKSRREGAVLVDATFAHAAGRAAFAQGLGSRGPVAAHLLCGAPPAVLAARMRARLADPERVSDATAAVLESQLASWEPFPADAPVISVDTTGSLGKTAAAAADGLDRALSAGASARSGG